MKLRLLHPYLLDLSSRYKLLLIGSSKVCKILITMCSNVTCFAAIVTNWNPSLFSHSSLCHRRCYTRCRNKCYSMCHRRYSYWCYSSCLQLPIFILLHTRLACLNNYNLCISCLSRITKTKVFFVWSLYAPIMVFSRMFFSIFEWTTWLTTSHSLWSIQSTSHAVASKHE